MKASTKESVAIADFLAQKRIALVGASRDPQDFSRRVLRELTRRGYDVVPVNAAGGPIEGRECCRRVQEITPPVQAALLMTSPRVTDEVVRDCAESAISRVWMHRGAGTGSVSAAAVEFCRQHGIAVVAGACPFMFLPRPGFIHRLHGALLRCIG